MNNVLGGLGGMMRQIGASMSNWEAQKKEAEMKALEVALRKQQMEEEANYRRQSIGLQQQQLQQQQGKYDFDRASAIAEAMGPGTILDDPTTSFMQKQGFGSLITPGQQDAQIPIPNIRGISAPTTIDMPNRWQGVMPPQLRAQMMTNSRLSDQFETNTNLALQRLQQAALNAQMRGDLAGQQAALAQIRIELERQRIENSGKLTPFQIEQLARQYADSVAAVPEYERSPENIALWNQAFTQKKNELSQQTTAAGKSGIF